MVINRQSVINTAASLGFFVFSTLVGLWFTPYLINELGSAAYGLVPLATTITSYMFVITLGLNSAVGRYLTVALEQRDYDDANRVFNTSLIGSALLVALLLVPALAVANRVDVLVIIPDGLEDHARWLFASTAVAFLLNTLKSPFEVSTFCANRFDLRNILAVTESASRVLTVVLLFWLVAANVWFVGIGAVVSTLVSFAGSLWLWRKLTPTLRFSWSAFDTSVLRSLVSTGGWVSLNTLGSILFLGIDLFVANRLLGAELAGRYAAVSQWSALLRGVASTIAGVFGPTMVSLYAKKDIQGLSDYANKSVKLLGLALGLPIGLISGFSGPLLHVWVGPDFLPMANLLTLVTAHLCINLAVLPLFGIQTATNHVKWPGIATLALGAGNLGLALLLAGPVGWGVYGVAAAGAFALTAKNLIFTPLYNSHILRQGRYSLLRALLPTVVATLAVTGVGRLFTLILDISTWSRLILAGTAVSVLYAGGVFFFLLSTEERTALTKGFTARRRSDG